MQYILDKHLDKGFIKVSYLLVAVLVIFIKIPNNSLRFYVDY